MNYEKQLAKALGEEIPSLPEIPQVVPTGFKVFDEEVLKIGGIPRGHLVNFYGNPKAGKTLLSLRCIAQAQKQDDRLAFVLDTEIRFDTDWAKAQGVDISRLVVIQGNYAEKTFERVLRAVSSGAVGVIVIDSLQNLISEKYADADMWITEKDGSLKNKQQVANSARFTTMFVQQLISLCHQHNVLMINISQVRANIGVLYGDPTTYTGGYAFKHNLAMSILLRAIQPIIVDDAVQAYRVSANVERNTWAPTAKTTDDTHLTFYLEGGLLKSEIMGYYDQCVRKELLVRGGAWYTLKLPSGDRRWQGSSNVIASFMSEPDLITEVKTLIE